MSLRRVAMRCVWALLALAALMIVLVPAPQPPQINKPAEEKWVAPRFGAGANAAADLAELARNNLWGGLASTESPVDERARQWRLAGIAGAAADRQVTVLFGDERILYVKAGDKFPDGTLIGEIRDNGVCVIIDGKKRLLPMPGQTIPMIW